MSLVTRTELLEIVPELRAMAEAAKTATARETLTVLANRYAAMATAPRGGLTFKELAQDFARNLT